MKKISLLVLLIASVFLITGCSNKKTVITGSEFKDKVVGIVNVSNYSAYYGIAKEAYQTEKTEYKVLYIEGNSLSDIKGMYVDEGKNMYAKAGIVDEYGNEAAATKVTKETRSGKNWSSIEITTEYKYYYPIYVENTILYMEGNLDQKDTLFKVRDAIKY